MVGTGGALSHYVGPDATARCATPDVRRAEADAAPDSYDWQFVPEAGKTFTDTGSNTCSAPPYRYIYNSGPDQDGAAANGWNLLDAGSKSTADALPTGTKGLVWVGDYDNTSCDWEVPDAALTDDVNSMIGDPKVAGYFFSDEPDPFACPTAPDQHKARSALIKSLDPSKFTVIVLDMNSGQDKCRLRSRCGRTRSSLSGSIRIRAGRARRASTPG